MTRTILVVDDTGSCGDTLAMVLSDLPDVDVHSVTSGQQALDLVKRVGLAALVTDLNMPHIDGFELIRRIRSEPRFATIPILVVTGDTDSETPARLRQLGANAFFTKPFSPFAVRNELERLLDAK